MAKNRNVETNVVNSNNVQVAVGERIKQTLDAVTRNGAGPDKKAAKAIEDARKAIEVEVKDEGVKGTALDHLADIASQVGKGAARVPAVVKGFYDALKAVLVAYPLLAGVLTALGIALNYIVGMAK